MRNLLISCLVGALLGAILTYRLMPAQTKIVTENHDIAHTVIQDRIITKVIKEPNGVTTIFRDEVKVETSKVDKKVVTSSLTTPVLRVPQYRGILLLSPTFRPQAVAIERRLIGPIWAGIQASKRKEILFTLGVEF